MKTLSQDYYNVLLVLHTPLELRPFAKTVWHSLPEYIVLWLPSCLLSPAGPSWLDNYSVLRSKAAIFLTNQIHVIKYCGGMLLNIVGTGYVAKWF